MPRRDDIKRILVLGSGPIIIGQACEFDYSGTQAVKALREDGYYVILVNSNPATIMTDPELAHRTYIEPLTPAMVRQVIEVEKPDALLATVGGQTALNLAMDLARDGTLERYGVELLGLDPRALAVAEDRKLFREAMIKAGLSVPHSGIAREPKDAHKVAKKVGFPLIIRPSYTLGGTGGGIAYNREELDAIVAHGCELSPIGEVLVEQSLLGWKEFELEVMRDHRDNFVVICSIENVDPMGVHTGDSITVAPAMTLSDREYQMMRDQAARVIRTVGVATGGSNIQFAQNPRTGELMVIEMNPRVSRSSALASKVTGFPIAKFATKLAVGYTLDEIPNDITRKTPASFEPTIDYVVVKIPRFDMDKFPRSSTTLGTQMKSVGETMALGRTFREALQKAFRSLDSDRTGFEVTAKEQVEHLPERLRRPTPERLYYVKMALQSGMSADEVSSLSSIDPFFVYQIEDLVDIEGRLRAYRLEDLPRDLLVRAKRDGFSDEQIGRLTQSDRAAVEARRHAESIRPCYKRVDTCGAEFEANTPYMYSTYDAECESKPTDRKKIMILGSGPNRIGQGIEFDYACVHAALSVREAGYEAIMVNHNPETVSTDYDTSDRLYFEPITIEDVMNIIDVEKPMGVMLQFGGQAPLKLAEELDQRGVPILGTTWEAIDLTEDRELFRSFLQQHGIPQPAGGTARSVEELLEIAGRIGYPVLVRPSFVLGGKGMFIAFDEGDLNRLARDTFIASGSHPVLVEVFLDDAFEGDIDLICDGQTVFIGGVMEHIEEAGVHSGDSACVLPPYMLEKKFQDIARDYATRLALLLRVKGLMNMQFAVKDDTVYVLEVNPRASRTLPYVSKSTGVPMAKVAARVMLGEKLEALGRIHEPPLRGVFAKAVVLPFNRFPEEDTLLGPCMKSTGEVMGIGRSFGEAFAKAQTATGVPLPLEGTVLISVNDSDKPTVLPIARDLAGLGLKITATRGTASYLRGQGLEVTEVLKVSEGRPHTVDALLNGDIQMVINTPGGKTSHQDESAIRRISTANRVPLITTMTGAWAAAQAIRELRARPLTIRCLQDVHAEK